MHVKLCLEGVLKTFKQKAIAHAKTVGMVVAAIVPIYTAGLGKLH